MNKYGESVGKWKLEVGGFDKELKPKKGDARGLLSIFSQAKDKGNDWLFDQFTGFITELIKRDHPPLNDEEKGELDLYVEYNLLELLQEAQITFRFSTRAEMDSLKKDLLQSSTSPSTKQTGSGLEKKRLHNSTLVQ